MTHPASSASQNQTQQIWKTCQSGKHVSMTRATRDEWRPKNPTWNAPAKGFSHEGSQKADSFCRRISERRLQNGISKRITGSDQIC